MDKWYNKAEKSNKEHKSSLYRRSDRVQLMRSKANLLDLYRELVKEDKNVIFIKDRKESSSVKMLLLETKRLKRPLSTRGRMNKKKLRITTPSLSKKEDENEDKNKNSSRDKARSRLEMVAPKAKCNVCKLKLKLDKQRVKRQVNHWHLKCVKYSRCKKGLNVKTFKDNSFIYVCSHLIVAYKS